MYEHLESSRPDRSHFFSSLSPRSESEIQALRQTYPLCPEEYLYFLAERGTGELEDEGERFVFEDRLLSAEHDYFQDRQIYDRGAKGDVLIFGRENTDTVYGFDTGDNWQVVAIDENRTVTKLKMSFEHFALGMFVCFPDIPVEVTVGSSHPVLRIFLLPIRLLLTFFLRFIMKLDRLDRIKLVPLGVPIEEAFSLYDEPLERSPGEDSSEITEYTFQASFFHTAFIWERQGLIHRISYKSEYAHPRADLECMMKTYGEGKSWKVLEEGYLLMREDESRLIRCSAAPILCVEIAEFV